MSEWISVKDRLPDNGDVLLFYENDSIYLGWFKKKSKFYGVEYLNYFLADNHDYDGSDAPIENVTHWQPLPEKPKNE